MVGAIFQITTFSIIVNNIGWKNAISLGTIAGLILIPIIWLIIRDCPSNHLTKVQQNYSKIFLGLLKIIKNPQMWIAGMVACILYLSLSLFAELWGIPFLSQVYQLSKNEAAKACSMIYVGWLVGGPLVGYLSDVTSSRKIPLVVSCLLVTLIISIIVYLPIMNLSLLKWLLFFFGLFASAEVICFAVSSENNPRYLIATASSFTNFLTMFSGFIAQPMVGKILDLLWSGDTINGLRTYSKTNYQIAFLILPLSFIGGLVLTFFLRETSSKKQNKKTMQIN
jgi:sugar phosphate permease